jgi:hypothetical protein
MAAVLAHWSIGAGGGGAGVMGVILFAGRTARKTLRSLLWCLSGVAMFRSHTVSNMFWAETAGV